jgi:hypothetical protein
MMQRLLGDSLEIFYVFSLRNDDYGDYCGVDFINDDEYRLDGKHVVFGRVKEGIQVVEAIENFGSADGKARAKVVRFCFCSSLRLSFQRLPLPLVETYKMEPCIMHKLIILRLFLI